MFYRDISKLTPMLRTKYYEFHDLMTEIGIPYTVTCTARELKDQVALYAQGRQPLLEVNDLRRLAKMPSITEEENKRRVTWTLKSKHLINLDDKDITNDLAKAFDIVILNNGKVDWNYKVDVNYDHISDYSQAGNIGESVGLVWGGRFKTPDYCHFEI